MSGITVVFGSVYKNGSFSIHDPEICIFKRGSRRKREGKLLAVRIFYRLPDLILGNNMAGCPVKGSTGSFFQLLFYEVGATGGKQQKADSSDNKIKNQKLGVEMLFHEAFTSNL